MADLTGLASVIQADARALPLPDDSVDLIVTSPPYYALRSYQDAGEHYADQIGAEPTPGDYINSLVACTREMVRALKPSGSIWVNLGDKYNAYNGGRGQATIQRNEIRQNAPRGSGLDARDIPNKSLMLLPERYRIACVDQLGLIARAVVVWSKPNGLPESVTDRVRRSHEDWVHLTKQPRYYSAVDAIREPYSPDTATRYRTGYSPATSSSSAQTKNGVLRADGGGPSGVNPLGKLPGSVWEIATEPLKVPEHLGVDHFAAFPTEWPYRIVLGWSPSGICTECGQGRRPTVTRERAVGFDVNGPIWGRQGKHSNPTGRRHSERSEHTIIGHACACTNPIAPTRLAVIVDPFGGTGTTALVAKALGRHGISIDRSADYCRLAQWRTSDPGELAKAMRVSKPPAQVEGQAALFEAGAW